MLTRVRGALRDSGTLALGEGAARLAGMVTLIVVSRSYGVAVLGAAALGQTIASYLMLIADSGARHTGARLLAESPRGLAFIVLLVQSRRVLLGLMAVALGIGYGLAGPVPEDARVIVASYAIAVLPYCMSLEWALWGIGNYTIMAVARAIVSVLPLAAIGVCVMARVPSNFAIPASAGLGFAGSALLSRWAVLGRSQPIESESERAARLKIQDALSWKPILVLGAAFACNQLFNNIDALLLGGLASLRQVGLYNGAYRLITAALGVYYLLTTATFPRLARVEICNRGIRHLRPYLILVATAGVAAGSLTALLSESIIRVFYGEAFQPAAKMLELLSGVIPLDFITTLCGTTLIAWGHSKRVLVATALSAVINVVANLIWIPKFGAIGACWATIVAYVAYLVGLIAVFPGWRGSVGPRPSIQTVDGDG